MGTDLYNKLLEQNPEFEKQLDILLDAAASAGKDDEKLGDMIYSHPRAILSKIFPYNSKNYDSKRAKCIVNFLEGVHRIGKDVSTHVEKMLENPMYLLGFFGALPLKSYDPILDLSERLNISETGAYIQRKETLRLISRCYTFSKEPDEKKQTKEEWEVQQLKDLKELFLNTYSPTIIRTFVSKLQEEYSEEDARLISFEKKCFDLDKAQPRIEKLVEYTEGNEEEVMMAMVSVFTCNKRLREYHVEATDEPLHHITHAIDYPPLNDFVRDHFG